MIQSQLAQLNGLSYGTNGERTKGIRLTHKIRGRQIAGKRAGQLQAMNQERSYRND
jgi:hypothetical protein